MDFKKAKRNLEKLHDKILGSEGIIGRETEKMYVVCPECSSAFTVKEGLLIEPRDEKEYRTLYIKCTSCNYKIPLVLGV